MAQGGSYRGAATGLTAGVTAIIFGAFLLPLVFPQFRAWGINHLLFLPAVFTWLFILLSSATIALLFRPALAASLYEKPARIVLGDNRPMRWLAVSIVLAICFWLLRLPVYVLGDSYSITQNLSNNLPVIYKWSETGAIAVADAVARLTKTFTDNPGLLSYNIISVLAGGVTVFFFCGIAYETGKNAAGRFFAFGLMLLGGWTVLFLGYTENYPVLWPFIAGYVYFALRYFHKKGSVIVPLVFLAAAMMLHLQTLFFLLSVPTLLFHHGPPARFYHAHRKSIVLAGGLIAAGAVVFGVYLYATVLEFRLYILPVLSRPGAAGSYTLFSWRHLLDIGNQLLLLMPIFPVLLVVGRRSWKSVWVNSVDRFLLLLTAGGIVFLFLIDPKLGMGRDWDLFALAGFPPLLLLARGVLLAEGKTRFYFPAILLALLTLTIPFFAVNLDYDAAIHKYEYLLRIDKNRSRSGITALREHYLAQGNTRAADSLKAVLVDYYPATRLVPQTYNLINAGDFSRARLYIDSLLALDPYAIELYNLRGTYFMKTGQTDSAVALFETAGRLGRYDERVLTNLAQAYSQAGRFDDMMRVLRRAQVRNPESPFVSEGLSTGLYMRQQYDSAYFYSRRLIRRSPDNPVGYLVAGFSAYRLNDRAAAKKHFERFLELAPNHPQAAQVRKILGQ